MLRRAFLKMLGLAPAAPLVAKVAEPATRPPVEEWCEVFESAELLEFSMQPIPENPKWQTSADLPRPSPHPWDCSLPRTARRVVWFEEDEDMSGLLDQRDTPTQTQS